MNNSKYTYQLKQIVLSIFISELLFFLLFFLVLWLMGYFSNASNDLQLAFKKEEKLQLLWVLLPLNILFIWFLNWKNTRLQHFGDEKILSLVVKPIKQYKVFLKYFFVRNALFFLILTMAQPIFGTKKVSATLETMELVIAIDVSNSMNVKDIEGSSRLEVVKRAMIQLVNNLHGEKIGISIFAGGSYLQLPLTSDYAAAKMYINEIETDMVSNQGTNIAAALEISARMFSKAKTSKSILIITDGENHEEGIDEQIENLKTQQIQLAVLGVGSQQGGLIPNNPDKPEFGHKLDSRGSTIVSKMNPLFVKNLAKQAGGFSVISQSPYPNLDLILEKFKHMKRTKIEGVELDVKENWFQIPLAIAIIFMILFLLPLDFSFLKK